MVLCRLKQKSGIVRKFLQSLFHDAVCRLRIKPGKCNVRTVDRNQKRSVRRQRFHNFQIGLGFFGSVIGEQIVNQIVIRQRCFGCPRITVNHGFIEVNDIRVVGAVPVPCVRAVCLLQKPLTVLDLRCQQNCLACILSDLSQIGFRTVMVQPCKQRQHTPPIRTCIKLLRQKMIVLIKNAVGKGILDIHLPLDSLQLLLCCEIENFVDGHAEYT